MAIPTVFAPVKNQDFTFNPVQVNKTFYLNSVDTQTTESGYFVLDGVHSSIITPILTQKAANDPTNSFDGSYQHVIWKSIDHMYYRNPYNPFETFEHSNRRYTFKFLNYSASILAMPYMDYGEAIKPGSVFVTQSTDGYYLSDDQNGNLYDVSLNTGSYVPRYNLIGYWGFNDTFRRTNYRRGTITDGRLGYQSNVFEPDRQSIVKNTVFDVGVDINSTGSGMAAHLDGTGCIMTYDRPEFNFTSIDDFTLSVWVNAPVSQSNVSRETNAIVSKRGTVLKQVFGHNPKLGGNDLMQNFLYQSASLENEDTPIYPYHLDIYNQSAGTRSGKIVFTRSDGISTLTMTSSTAVNDGAYHHIAVVRSGSTAYLYIDGVQEATTTDRTLHPINNHNLIFGSQDLAYTKGFSGSIDEIRLYGCGASSASVGTLSDNTSSAMYQTAVVGNVFYRKGNVVVSSLNPKYHNVFKNTWHLKYKGTHTIYQYEVLCRVKKGSFNLTYNPTARLAPNSDLYSPDMTGSLLLPYATTIGLYNDIGELVAVGKLGQPIQMRDDVDLNFMLRWHV